MPQGEENWAADYKFYDFMGEGLVANGFCRRPRQSSTAFCGGEPNFHVPGHEQFHFLHGNQRCDYSSMVHPTSTFGRFQLNANGMPDPDKLWVGSDAFFL